MDQVPPSAGDAPSGPVSDAPGPSAPADRAALPGLGVVPPAPRGDSPRAAADPADQADQTPRPGPAATPQAAVPARPAAEDRAESTPATPPNPASVERATGPGESTDTGAGGSSWFPVTPGPERDAPPTEAPTPDAPPAMPVGPAGMAAPRNGPDTPTSGGTEPAARREPVLGAPPPALARALGMEPIGPAQAAGPTAPPGESEPAGKAKWWSDLFGSSAAETNAPERSAGESASRVDKFFKPTGATEQAAPAGRAESSADGAATELDDFASAGDERPATFGTPGPPPPVLRPPTVDLGDESLWADSGLTTELPQLADDAPPPAAQDDFDPQTYARPDPYGMSDSMLADDFGGYRQSEVDNRQKTKPKRRFRYEITGGLVLIGLVVVLVVLLLGGDPDEMPTTPAAAEVPGADPKEVNLVLATPDDNSTKVNLSWRSSRELNFAVVVAEEGKDKADVWPADRNHSMTIEVDPNLKYCFMVQATDGNNVYESKLVAIRGANCRE